MHCLIRRKGIGISAILLMLFSVSDLFGQFKQFSNADLERIIEARFQQQEGTTDFEDFYETLFNLFLNPLDLNSLTVNDLDFLYALTPQQISSFLSYRRQYGPIISVYELQAIPYFDLKTIRDILPFVTVRYSSDRLSTKPFLQRVLNEQNNSLIMGYQMVLEENLNADDFIGDNNRIFGRFRVSHPGDYSIGFLFDKDAGEKFRFDGSEKTYGFDFYSYHLYLQDRGRFEKIVVGDYQLQFGQGLLTGAGFGVGKGASTISTIKRNNTGIIPYSSSLENGFFKGIATTYRLSSQWKTTTFFSSVLEDVGAELDTLLAEPAFFATSAIRTSGLHRTEREIRDKDRVRNTTVGGNILFENKNKTFYVGSTLLYNHFSLSIFPGDRLYQRFNFSGQENYTYGIYGNYLFDNINIFGEYSKSRSGGDAYIGGLTVSLSRHLDFSFSLRDYDRDFHAINGLGRAFGESGNNFNEKGLYWGLYFKPLSQLQIAAYYDKFSFPWLRFQADAPSEGQEYLIRVTYTPVKKVTMYGELRQENKQRSVLSDGANISVLEDQIIRRYKFNINYSLSRNLKLKSLFMTSSIDFNGEKGTGSMLAQDLDLDINKFKLSFRFSLIEGDEVPMYAYEKDVLYGTFRGQFFNGTRHYVILQYKASRNLNLRMKYARSSTPEDVLIRSISLDGISGAYRGNTLTDLRFLLQYSF